MRIFLLRVLLLPIAPIYFSFTWLRNKIYDLGIIKRYQSKSCIISVGNLSMGGTGKTPFVQLLLSLILKDIDSNRISVLSRGYRRKTKGFQIVTTQATPIQTGDEPLQIKRRFPNISVSVSENRKKGIEKIQKLYAFSKIILLDDGFQRREIQKDLDILLTTYTAPFYKDWILPMGNLRELSTGKKRADLIVVTKCPDDISVEDKKKIERRINSKCPVLFSHTDYSDKLYSVKKSTCLLNGLKNVSILTIAGISNPLAFETYISQFSQKVQHISYLDHHPYTPKDILYIKKVFAKGQYDLIITTEKDFTRLLPYQNKLPQLFYLPIEVKMSQRDSSVLKRLVMEKIAVKEIDN